VGAKSGKLGERGSGVGGTLNLGHLSQQLDRVIFGEDANGDPPRPVPGNEIRHVGPAGYDHERLSRSRQQRAHLFGTPGVVKHNEQPLSRHQ
jgi:hypothetical protein